jgi:PIN domain nuclease of toxin-antitoxin system
MPFVTDTHALVWYLIDDPRLSPEAKRIFNEDYIFIPCIILFELLYLIEKEKIAADFDGFLSLISFSKNYRIEPLCLPIIEKSKIIPKEKVADPWDRLIVATSMHLNFPLITRDKTLKEIGLEVIW